MGSMEGFTAQKFYDKTINSNRGNPLKNPHGNRRLNPKKAPYEKYLSELSNSANKNSVKLFGNFKLKYHNLTGTKEVKENFQNKFIKTSTNKFIKAEENIKKIIKKDKNMIVEKPTKKCNVETFANPI